MKDTISRTDINFGEVLLKAVGIFDSIATAFNDHSGEDLTTAIGRGLSSEFQKRSTTTPENKREQNLENQAIGLIFRYGPNVSRIADEIGVSRTTPYEWPYFRLALEKMKGAARDKKRGFVDTDGEVDAYD